jgi:hypothetical protein
VALALSMLRHAARSARVTNGVIEMAKAKGNGSKGKSSESRKATAPNVYRMPATAAQLNILCCFEVEPSQPCLKPVAYYDPAISDDPREACLCETCPRSNRAVKLLVRADTTEGVELGVSVA